ncbi:hypothetical protein Calag_0640 [Caldisphaera lagunensis DSM 15908]|uniref:Uncharacterized protein n=1 Tax=Caldisphaera lagunensis (strain DSM 15908 / JCM 11604 / ANMR 0165 / IC-154) TaxID=1056495 RepID=L0ABG8_CALLD|nr:NAD(P)/FAD-dependent oxidoreductase [Caldisphaera lagunensis]AFZ70395.1 hypothetical protein Calag_0640 [Caldisphaera lagunensis DSM 15908]
MKIAVIGAGFAGLIISNYMLKANIDVDLYEEHSKTGIPEHCTGIVSSLTSKLIGNVSKKNILKEFKGVNIKSYGNSAKLYTKEPIIKLDRVKLENDLLNNFIDKGGKVFLKSRIYNLDDINEKNYDAIIISDGVNGFLHKKYGLGFSGRLIYGINQEFCLDDYKSNFDVVFDNITSHNFFSWYVPLGNKVIVGTGAEDPKRLVIAQQNAIKYFNIKSKPCNTYGGLIISGINKVEFRKNKLIAMGDNIGLTKPLTGGGLFPNSLTAYLAYSLINKGFNILDSLEFSISYVLRILKKTNNLSIYLHKNPEIVRELIEISKRTDILKNLNGEIDYDLHNDIISKTFKNKDSYKFLLYFMANNPKAFFTLGNNLLKDFLT